MPFITKDTFAPLRGPSFRDIEFVAVRLESKQSAAVVLSRRNENLSVDGERCRNIAFIVGDIRISPEQGSRIGGDAENRTSRVGDELIFPGDLEQCR